MFQAAVFSTCQIPDRSGLPSAVRGREPAAAVGVWAGTRFIESHATPSSTRTTTTMREVRPTRLVISSPSLLESAARPFASLVGVLQGGLYALPAPLLPHFVLRVRIATPSPRHRPWSRKDLGVFDRRRVIDDVLVDHRYPFDDMRVLAEEVA